jgi:hypothetical protein
VNISGATSANYNKVPAVEAVDSGLYRVIASNNWGSVTSSAVYVSLTNSTLAPTITPTDISGTINQAITPYQITATEGPTSYGAASLPTGLSVNSTSGLITGTVTTAGTNTVTLGATNSIGGTVTNITVRIASVVSTNISVGSRVQVNISPTLRVRDSAALAGTILGDQNYEAQGTVIGGPTTADGYVWWQINYDTAPDGWSIQGSGSTYWLIVTPGGDTNAPTITVTSHTDGMRTNTPSQIIAGTASDDGGIAEVTYIWRLPDGTTTIATNATGTTSWSFPVSLFIGSNHFSIWATDTSSNTNTTELGVTYAPNGSAGTINVGTVRATNLRITQ